MGLVCIFGVAVLVLHTHITHRFPNIPPAPEPELLLPNALPKPRRRQQDAPYVRVTASSGSSAGNHSSSSLNGAAAAGEDSSALPQLALNGAANSSAETDGSAAAGALRGPGEASSSNRGVAACASCVGCMALLCSVLEHRVGG